LSVFIVSDTNITYIQVHKIKIDLKEEEEEEKKKGKKKLID
jgi:hypothetical protein